MSVEDDDRWRGQAVMKYMVLIVGTLGPTLVGVAMLHYGFAAAHPVGFGWVLLLSYLIAGFEMRGGKAS